MNNLEEKCLAVLNNEIDLDMPPIKPYTDMVSVSEALAKLTTDVSIKFLEYIEDNYYSSYEGRGCWVDCDTGKLTSKSEIFEKFIASYGK